MQPCGFTDFYGGTWIYEKRLIYYDAMAPEDRALFLRVYYLDQTVEEIAAVTGRNPSTLKSRLRRGREKLKRDLTEKGVC